MNQPTNPGAPFPVAGSSVALLRSWQPDAFLLPEPRVLLGVDLHISQPRALRLPIDVPPPNVVRVALLNDQPVVNSFPFSPPAPGLTKPAQAINRTALPGPLARTSSATTTSA